MIVSETSRRSPPVGWKTAAMRSINAAGGSSATKRWQSSVEINLAVEGCEARMSRTVSPSWMPPRRGSHGRERFSGRCRGGADGRRTHRSAGRRPAGEAARDFLHIFLRVTAVDAEGVEFHDFARVIFVDAADLLRLVVDGLHGRRRASCCAAIWRRRCWSR